jgi:hypothetical protein
MSNALDMFRSAKNEIPDIKFKIPSTGEDIFLRPFTTREQKGVLKAIEKEDQVLINEAFDKLIKNCVLTEGFKVEDLLTKDRDILLIELRKESVKDDVTYHWKCPKCEFVNSSKVSLKELKFKKLKDKRKLTKDIKLSDRDISLRLQLPSIKFERMILNHIGKVEKDKVSAVDMLNTTLAVSISKMLVHPKDDNESHTEMNIDFKDRISILEEMCIDDKKKIEKFLEGIDVYGYDLNIGKKSCCYKKEAPVVENGKNLYDDKGTVITEVVDTCTHTVDVELNWSDFFLM